MVAEPRCTCTVVRDGDRRGDRQACWRLVEEGSRVVGDVRGGGPEGFRLIVQMLASETGERVSTVLLDVLAVKLADRMPDGAVSMQDVAIQDVATHDMRRGALVRRIRAFIDSHLGVRSSHPRLSRPPTTSRCATCTSCSSRRVTAWPV